MFELKRKVRKIPDHHIAIYGVIINKYDRLIFWNSKN